MTINLNVVPSLLAAAAAVALSLPHDILASFVVGGADCTHKGRKDGDCDDVGPEDCTLKRKVCNSGTEPNSICTEDGGNSACGNGTDMNCAGNHARDSSLCGNGG